MHLDPIQPYLSQPVFTGEVPRFLTSFPRFESARATQQLRRKYKYNPANQRCRIKRLTLSIATHPGSATALSTPHPCSLRSCAEPRAVPASAGDRQPLALQLLVFPCFLQPFDLPAVFTVCTTGPKTRRHATRTSSRRHGPASRFLSSRWCGVPSRSARESRRVW